MLSINRQFVILIFSTTPNKEIMITSLMQLYLSKRRWRRQQQVNQIDDHANKILCQIIFFWFQHLILWSWKVFHKNFLFNVGVFLLFLVLSSIILPTKAQRPKQTFAWYLLKKRLRSVQRDYWAWLTPNPYITVGKCPYKVAVNIT